MEKNTKLMYVLAIFISWISSLIFFLNAQSNEEKEEAKLSLNFEISFTIVAFIASFVIGFILGMVGLGLVAPLVSLAIWLYHAFIDFKAMKAVEEGKTPGFPINFNLVK